MGESVPLGYDELSSLLYTAGIDEAPAAVHGAACSTVSIFGVHGLVPWRTQVLDTGATVVTPEDELARALHGLYDATSQALGGDTLGLELLLPMDSAPMAERAAALAQWAAGFLHGLGAGAEIGDMRHRLAAEPLDEIIADMTEISRAADQVEDNDTDTAFAEIVEYVRVAAQLVYEELAPVRDSAADGAVH